MPRAKASTKIDVAALMKKADSLLDETPPQLDQAIPLLRDVVEAEPSLLLGLHSLSWCLDPTRRLEPHRWERELKAEHWRLRDQILQLTRGTKPGGALTLAQRARSLALSQWAEDLVRRKPTVAQLEEVEAALDEAHRLRPIPDHQRARRGLEAWRSLTQGKKERGFRALLESVAAMAAQGVTDDADPLNFQGLEGAFSDEGLLAWLRKQQRAPVPGGKRSKELDAGLLLAAGLDAKPFFGPCFEGNSRTGRVLALVALGANIEAKDSGKRGVLHLAAMVDDPVLVQELLRLGARADAVDSSRATPLHLAAEYGSVSCIGPLAKGSVPVGALDASGRTALFEARQVDVARALIEAGANPNAGKGWTPLHQHARFKERGPVIEVLLQAGADVSAKDRSGQTPAQEALKHKHADLARLLGARASPGKAGALDVQPLLEALARQREALLEAWYFEDETVEEVEQLLEGLTLQGATSWDDLAASLQGALPWVAMAVVQLAREALPSEGSAPRLSRLPRLVRGDLVVKGDLHVDGPLLVTGALTVEGVLRNAGMEGMVVVGGTLRVTGLDTNGEVVVGRDLEAQVVWGHGNDASLRVGGVLKADVVIADDHDVQARVKAKHHYENGGFDARDAALRKVFAAGAFARSELDREKLFKVLRKGWAVRS